MPEEVISRHLSRLSLEENLDYLESRAIGHHDVSSLVFLECLLLHELLEHLDEDVVLREGSLVFQVQIAIEEV